MRKSPEHDLQKSIVKYMKLQHPKVFMNGSMGGVYIKHFSQRNKAKDSGYKKGFPDLFIYCPAIVEEKLYHGLAIELKVKGNYPTKIQKNVLNQLNQSGYLAKVCTGFDQTIETIETYLANDFPNQQIHFDLI